MTPYLALAATRGRLLLQYRLAALAGFATQLFWGLIRIMILAAFYEMASGSQPLSLREAVTYIWLTQALLAILPMNLDPEIQALVRSGGVAHELLRPLDLYWQWFSRAVAQRLVPTAMRAVPLSLLAMVFFTMEGPIGPGGALAALVAVAGAVLLSAAFSTLFNVALLYTLAGEGLSRLGPMMAYCLSGLILPLPLFPDRLRHLVEWLPFSGLVDRPIRLYLGHIPWQEAGWVLGHQFVWCALLVLLGRGLLQRAIRHLEINGG